MCCIVRWGAAITCGGLLVSWLNDNLGVKRSLCIGFTISMASAMLVALTSSKTLLYVTLFVLYPFGTAMGIPMLTVAVKRYTTTKNRGAWVRLTHSQSSTVNVQIAYCVWPFLRVCFRDVLLSDEYGSAGEWQFRTHYCQWRVKSFFY